MNNSSLKKYLTVKNTKKYGKGVFAQKNILKGSTIYYLDGKRVDVKDVVANVNQDKEAIDDPLQIGKRTYLDLDEFSRTFNHSCDPNGGLRETSKLVALKNIVKGEEITYDYSLTIAPTEWKMKCGCGSIHCRKILGDVRSIPKKQLQGYKKNGAIQRYMKILLKEIENKTYKIPSYEITALEHLKIKHNKI